MIQQEFLRKVQSKTKQIIETRRQAAIYEAKEWKLDARGWLYRTSTVANRKAMRPGPYSFPLMVTGQLRRALHYRVSKIKHPRGNIFYSFKIEVRFDKVEAYNLKNGKPVSRGTGFDYSEYLDSTEGKYYSKYRQRLVDKLEERLHRSVRRIK